MIDVLIVGSGKRVQETALPALLRLEARYRVRGIYARSEKELQVEGRTFRVQRLADLDQETVSAAQLVYMVVGKQAVPSVLATLTSLDISSLDLLIDTPVLLFKHLGHLRLLERFRNAWVPEDCTTLPVYDVLDRFLATGAIGELRRATLDRSGYAYHGIAMGRRLLGAQRVRSAKRSRAGAGLWRRTVRYDVPGELVILEPRDYGRGHLTLEGSAGCVSDDPARGDAHRLSAQLEGATCSGFRIGDLSAPLARDERSLMGLPLGPTDPSAGGASAGVSVWMEGMKRVGFLRLLRRIADGAGAYPLGHGVEDCVVDYHLEKLGRYVANPLTSAHYASARALMRLLTRVVG